MIANIKDRKFLGKQKFKGQVWGHGRDRAALLSEIVGWAVGCPNECENAVEVAELLRRGLITTRRHVAPIGEWDAYALTDAGFDLLARIGYGTLHDDALKAHRFYLAAA